MELLFVLVPASCLILLAALIRVVPALWTTVGATDMARNHTVDGARGLLALWVLTFHMNIGPQLGKSNGGWTPPQSMLGDLMRSGLFVAPFFVLTAMIFGGRLLQTRGELKTLPFLKKRMFRIFPAYLLSVLLIFCACFALTGLELRVTGLKLAKEIFRWFLLDFVERYDVNTIDVSRAHGMLWTLRNEILFYLCLPLLAFLQRRLASPAPLFIGLAVGALFTPAFVFFFFGVVAAAVFGLTRQRHMLAWQVAAVAAVAALILSARLQSGLLDGMLLIPIMVSLVQQGMLFRWLCWRPLRFVGEVSYSLYILHYPCVWIVYTAILQPDWAERLPYFNRVLLDVALGTVLIGIATFAFVGVERPFVRLGGRVSIIRLLRSIRAAPTALRRSALPRG